MIIFTVFNKASTFLFVSLIKLYQGAVSPFFPAACRHYPTCSTYTIQSLKRFGVMRGGLLGADRIIRCNPFGTSGYDPVPVIWIRRIFWRRGPRCSRLKPHLRIHSVN
ncbi:MAG: membrane protein insertion efficiency factor YidD [Bacteroidales bacterium]|nr:membrane protein insertion efficiency factor YidD [Bacteroidales bacterium]MDD3663883.1 membrane protein insertion efficiency factor YidD [Bacteroidales bacterium]